MLAEYKEPLKNLIKNCSDAINHRNFQKLYEANAFNSYMPNCVITEFLQEFNIDPLRELTGIPEKFMAEVPGGKLTIPKNVKKIYRHAFSFTAKLNDLIFEKDSQCTSIGKEAFSFCTFSSLALPESLRVLEDRAFSMCYFLRTLVLPENLLSIGKNVFIGSKLNNIYYTGSIRNFDRVARLLGSNIKDFETNEVRCPDGIFTLMEK